MKAVIVDRILEEAKFIIETSGTVRSTAKIFGVSKSTVYTDLSERLKGVSPNLYIDVNKVMTINKQVRHLRGAESTRRKYKGALN